MVEQDCRAPYRICERRIKDTKYTDTHRAPSSLQVLPLAFFVCWTMYVSTAHPLPDDGTLQVGQLQFHRQLENPCRRAENTPPLRNTTVQDRRNERRGMVEELKARVVLVNRTAATIQRENMLQDCAIIPQSLVARVPFADDVSNDKPLDVLRDFYASLLNHTAHVYFMSEQLSRYSDQTCYNRSLHDATNTLSEQLLQLMCVLRLSMLTLPDEGYDERYFQDLTSQMLGEQLIDLPVCTRRQLRDCTAMYSTVTLLAEMTSYLADRVLVVENEPS